jgi:hypothetical protein
MEKITLIILAIAAALSFGFAFKSILIKQSNDQVK